MSRNSEKLSNPPADTVRRFWRCGGQVGRTLYVDHGVGEKDPALLFGLVDSAEIAAHIVEVHNWWLTVTTEAEAKWAEMQAEHSDGSEEWR